MTPRITSHEQMLQAVGQLGRLYGALAALRREVEPLNPQTFAILAEGHLDDIRRLHEELDRYAGAVAARDLGVPLWVRVIGPGIEGYAAPTSVLTSILDALRKGVATVAEFILTGGLTTRPTAALKTASDLRILALAPGSLRVGVRLPDGEGEENRAASEALGDYLNVASWAGSGRSTEALEELIPDSRRRTVVLTEVARLVPREKGQVETVELSGVLLAENPEPVVLSRPSRERINGAIDRAAAERVETHVGDLREIDLDESSFVLRNAEDGSPQVRCYFPAEMVEAAKEALDKRIRVTGARPVKEGRHAPPLMVSRLEIVDEQ